jgi:NAD(P)-dependent dehydrogenase (short-subunit alcohol dehydrogenase family)
VAMGKLDGKIALITGGNSGIGLATAKRFVAEGAHVFITGRRKAELEAAVKEIGDTAAGVAGDVSNLADLARTWTTDLKSRRIRVNAISPGTIDTPGLNNLLSSGEAGEERKKMISTAIPLGRLGKPVEIAAAVVFLASNDASYITGTELFIDGGFAQV